MRSSPLLSSRRRRNSSHVLWGIGAGSLLLHGLMVWALSHFAPAATAPPEKLMHVSLRALAPSATPRQTSVTHRQTPRTVRQTPVTPRRTPVIAPPTPVPAPPPTVAPLPTPVPVPTAPARQRQRFPRNFQPRRETSPTPRPVSNHSETSNPTPSPEATPVPRSTAAPLPFPTTITNSSATGLTQGAGTKEGNKEGSGENSGHTSDKAPGEGDGKNIGATGADGDKGPGPGGSSGPGGIGPGGNGGDGGNGPGGNGGDGRKGGAGGDGGGGHNGGPGGDGVGPGGGGPYGVGGRQDGGPPRHIVYILDVSLSMEPSIERAKGELHKALSGLGSDETFGIVALSHAARRWKKRLVPANAADIAQANAWINAMSLDDGTNLERAMRQAFGMRGVNTIVLVTDGVPTDGVQDFVKLGALVRALNTGGARIDTVGLKGDNPPDAEHPAPNEEFEATALLQQIARDSGGTFKIVASG